MDGTFRDSQFVLVPEPVSSRITIAVKDASGLAVSPSYENRVQVEIGANETKITFLAVSRSDSGNYKYTIRNTGLQSEDSNLDLSVQCKLYTFRGLALYREKIV